MVKVFPAGCFGPDYFKNGASAVAIGPSVFRKEWITAGKFPLILRTLRAYLKALPCRGSNCSEL